jgi:hypothetical protein
MSAIPEDSVQVKTGSHGPSEFVVVIDDVEYPCATGALHKELQQKGGVPILINGVQFGLVYVYCNLFKRFRPHLCVPDGPYKGYLGPALKNDVFYMSRSDFDKYFRIVLFKYNDRELVSIQVGGIDKIDDYLCGGWSRSTPRKSIDITAAEACQISML